MKTFLKIFTTVVSFVILVSCGKTDQRQITVALFKAPASDALVKIINEFEKENSIKVNVQILPYGDLKAKLEQNFIAKSSDYDVIMADCIWIPGFANKQYLGELDSKIATSKKYDTQDIFPALLDYLGKYPKDGVLYGMPFMSNTHMMAYRKSIVGPIAKSFGYSLPGEDQNSAWTWEQYLKVANRISQKYSNTNPKIYGTSLQARAGAWLIYEWYSILFGFQNSPKNRITGLPVFDKDVVEAMNYYSELYKNAPREALTWGHEEETSNMCMGNCAMDATSNVELAAVLMNANCKSEDLAFAFPPKGKDGISSPDMGGYGLLLSNFSKNKEFASKFIMWCSSKIIHEKIVLNGGSPIRISEIKNKDILKKYPYLKFYDKLIESSVYRARIPQWTELEDVLSRELTSVMKGEKKAELATYDVQKWISLHIK